MPDEMSQDPLSDPAAAEDESVTLPEAEDDPLTIEDEDPEVTAILEEVAALQLLDTTTLDDDEETEDGA